MWKSVNRRLARLLIPAMLVSASLVVTALPAAASGVWNLVAPPNVGTGPNLLEGVSCTSSTSCIAVGYYLDGSVDQTLVEQLSGTTWSVDSSPNEGTYSNSLRDVSCTSSTFCIAVGQYGTAGVNGALTLVEQFNGTTWSIVSSPNQTASYDGLYSVSCTSSAFCVAVGSYDTGLVTRVYISDMLVEQLSGTTWSVDSSPSPGTNANGPESVSCTSSTACVATGYYTNTGDPAQTLVEQLSGTTWSLDSSPNEVTTGTNVLQGVACTSSTSCTAVGFYVNTSGIGQTLIEQLSGTTWAIVSSLNEGTGNNYPASVSCTSSTSCITVVQDYNTSGIIQTLIEQLSGTTWSVVSSPNDGTSNNNFLGVSCSSLTSCAAVGWYDNTSGTAQMLIEEQFSYPLQATLPIQPGSLAFVTAPTNITFSTITLNGIDQTATATQVLDIGDATGFGNGWNVTLSATQFTNGTQTLPDNDFSALQPNTPVCDVGSTCTPATLSSALYTYSLSGSATELLSAAATTGLADQTVDIPWAADIPANTYSGTYTSTWTVTLVSGP